MFGTGGLKMPKYEIYQMGKLPPLTVVEAEKAVFENCQLYFVNYNRKVKARFNWNNIAGFKEVANG